MLQKSKLSFLESGFTVLLFIASCVSAVSVFKSTDDTPFYVVSALAGILIVLAFINSDRQHPQTTSFPGWKFITLCFLFHTALVFVFYARALNIYFIEDDWRLLQYARDITDHFSFSKIVQYLVAVPTNHPLQYKPLPYFSVALDYALWGMNLEGYHVTNFLFYAGSALAVSLIGASLLRSRLAGFAAGLLFLLNPLHSGQVIWIACREEIIADFFYLFSIIFWILYISKTGKRLFFIISLFFMVLTGLSKYVVVTLPLSIIIVDMVLHEKCSLSFIRSRIKYYFPYLALLCLYLLTHILIFGKIARPSQAQEAHLNTLNGWLEILKILTLILPKTLLIPINDNGVSIIAQRIIIAFISFMGFYFILRKKVIKKLTPFIFMSLWIIILIMPVANALQGINNMFLTRFYFLSTTAFSILISFILFHIFQDLRGLSFAGSAALLAFFAYGTVVNGNFWMEVGRRSRMTMELIDSRYPDFLPDSSTLYLHDEAVSCTWHLFFGYGFTDTPHHFYIRHVDKRLNSLPTGEGEINAFELSRLNPGEKDFIFTWNFRQQKIEDVTTELADITEHQKSSSSFDTIAWENRDLSNYMIGFPWNDISPQNVNSIEINFKPKPALDQLTATTLFSENSTKTPETRLNWLPEYGFQYGEENYILSYATFDEKSSEFRTTIPLRNCIEWVLAKNVGSVEARIDEPVPGVKLMLDSARLIISKEN